MTPFMNHGSETMRAEIGISGEALGWMMGEPLLDYGHSLNTATI